MLQKNLISLKKYTLRNKIASGSFGTVYEVENKETGEINAAKIMMNEIDEDDSLLKNFKREVSIISRIKHPSVLKFIGISMTNFRNEKKPVIITDYLPNGSLNDILRKSEEMHPPKQWDDTKKLINIYGIAAAMAFLHSNQILHRDLKPANILMDKSLYPIIADFGISKDKKMVSTSTNGNDGLGTPAYMAPEIWSDNIYSKEGDVYAFAFIVYEIIANKDPFSFFQGMNAIQVGMAVCDGKRPDTSFIKEPYKSLIEKCWSQDAMNRPSFRNIMNDLRHNEDYRKNTIDNEEYNNYIKYIKNSPQDFISIIDPKYKNVIDIVFLIDGLKSSEHFKQAIKESFQSIAKKCISKYPKTYFQFGVIVYYDLIASQKSNMKHKYYQHYLELTDSLEDVQKFIDNIQLKSIDAFKNGCYYANDLASGYHAVLNRIRWDKNSEKIVIHLCNSPTYGKYFTIDPQNNDLMRVPIFYQNMKLKECRQIYDDINAKQNNWLIFLIRSLVEEGIKIYCLNTSESAIFCLSKILSTYKHVDGKTFLIKNLFNQNDSLNKELTEFTLNIIKSLINESIGNEFESEINEQFKKDLDKYLFPNKIYLDKINKLQNEISTAKYLIHCQFNTFENNSKVSICDMVKQTLQKYNELNTQINNDTKDNTKDRSHTNSKIQQLNEKIKDIENQKSVLSEKYHELLIKNKNSDAKIKDIENQKSALSEKYHELMMNYKNSDAKIKDIENQKSELSEKYHELLMNYKNSDDKIKDIENQKSELSEKYQELLIKNKNSYHIIKSMNHRIEKLQEEIQLSKIENSSANDRINEVQEENKNLHDQIDGLREILNQYKGNITKLNDTNIDLHRKNRTIKKILLKEYQNKK